MATQNLMVIGKQDFQSLADNGIPQRQAEAFAEIAQQENCIILSRVPGKACFDLLEAGYDAKSYHIKGKSCDWGPMAGFVCLDPLLNKNGIHGAAGNAYAHKKSLTDKYEHEKRDSNTLTVTPIQIQIKQDHLTNLIENGTITVNKESDDYLTGLAQKDTLKFSFLLKKGHDDRWDLFYCLEEAYSITTEEALTANNLFDCFANKLNGKFSDTPETKKEEIKSYQIVLETILKLSPKESGITFSSKHYVPVLAMTNPNPGYLTGDYRNALTGDYDLFAVWPCGKNETDVRLQPMVAGVTTNDDILKNENQTVGNISERVYYIGQLINSVIGAKYNNSKPNRIYHSDEGGRPFVKDIDLPVAIFTPDLNNEYVGFIIRDENHLADFIEKIKKIDERYAIFVNTGWRKALSKVATLLENS